MTPLKSGDLVAERYRLLRTIGEGGMGSVWAAHHELIGRDVAIKVTGEHLASRPEIRERFQNEARAVGRLRHPNIIDVMDVGQLPDGSLYIVFELLEGTTLAEHLELNGRLGAFDGVTIAIEVCRALEAAHGAGVVHRDLKPANIFLHRSPVGGVIVKVLDFGISKSVDAEGVSLSMTQTGVVLGTPQYMSFEQARGTEDVDLRTDIWGVGAILYELLSARLPFEAPNYNAMLYKILHDDPEPMSRWGLKVPVAVERVLARCLAKNRSQRYGSATELREALEAMVHGLSDTSSILHVESSSSLPVASSFRRTPINVDLGAAGVVDARATKRALDETMGMAPFQPPPDDGIRGITTLSSSMAPASARRGRLMRSSRSIAVAGALACVVVLASGWAWKTRALPAWTRGTARAGVAAPDPSAVTSPVSSTATPVPTANAAPPASAETEVVRRVPTKEPPAVVTVNDDSAPEAAARSPRKTAPSSTPLRRSHAEGRPLQPASPKLTKVDSAGF